MTLQLQALLGIALFIAVVLPMSSNWRRINWKLVVIAVLLQFVICLLLLKAPIVKEGLLYLNGLKALSPTAASALARHRGDLYLEGLATLPDDVAQELAKHGEGWLYLNGLTSLSPEAAEALRSKPNVRVPERFVVG